MKFTCLAPFLFVSSVLCACGIGMLVSGGAAVRAASIAAASSGQPSIDGCGTIRADNIDDCVRINQIQVLGTHNSYHLAPKPAMLAALGERARGLEYTHRPLTEQLSTLGIRQFELDVFAGPQGGRYARPHSHELTGDRSSPAMDAPGFKVLHVQDVDIRSTCPTLVACLTEIRTWSLANPGHLPVMVMIEAKDAVIENRPGFEFVVPHPIRAKELDALDAEIRSVFGTDDHVLTPDRVRGDHASLDDAVRTKGWPTLRQARGKVIFALDNTDQHRDDYVQGHPSLKGRMLFVTAPDGDPASAFLKLNEARGPEEARIRERVAAGYLVRTRADEPTAEARSGDTTRRDSAFRSGAQYVSTDYPEASPFGSGYIARLPGKAGIIARCNPVNAPSGCRDEWLERRGRQSHERRQRDAGSRPTAAPR